MRCLNNLYILIIGLLYPKCIAHTLNLSNIHLKQNSGLITIDLINAGSDEANIVFFYGSTSQSMEIYHLNEASEILNHPKFDLNRKTVLYIHGYIETLASQTVQKIIDAYIKQGTHNILILDWSTLADGLYPTAVRKSNQLGPVVAEAFINLFEKGMQSDLLHIVGHSLGAQLAGQIGRTISEISNNKIKLQRISGLDPAFPQYYPAIGGTNAISKNDAILVDIIHTDGGRYGTPLSTGTVDFWPNGGSRIQPGCPEGIFVPLSEKDLCSHQRSVTLWAESVSNPLATFYATKSNSKSTKLQMGINCSIHGSAGNYNLLTDSRPPYSRAAE